MEFAMKNLTAGQLNAIVKKLGGEEGALRLLAGAVEIVFKILAPFRTVKIAAQAATTTSEEYFREARIKTFFAFKDQFLGLDVSATEASELSVWKLYETSTSGQILDELKGKAEISIAEFKSFVQSLPWASEDFICYLRGKDGNLWEVHVSWNDRHDFWGASAGLGSLHNGARAGRLVVSRN